MQAINDQLKVRVADFEAEIMQLRTKLEMRQNEISIDQDRSIE